jgi:Fe-S cluster assembly protein SufD
MNIHASQKLTPAEAALVGSFERRVADLPGDTTAALRRDSAVEQLKAGLPTRRVEAWHYTDLRRLLSAVPEFDPLATVPALEPLLDGSAVHVVSNGKAVRPAGTAGVEAGSFADLLRDGTASAALQTTGSDDAVGAINAAFVSDGHAISIAEGVDLQAPIELQNVHAGGQVHARFPVKVGAGARAVIVERQTGTAAALASSVSTVDVGANAEIVWVILQEQPGDAVHLGQFVARLAEGSSLTLFVMNTGAKLVRQEIRVSIDGEGAAFKLRGINLLAGDAHCDVTMVLDHAAAHTESTEIVRNVVTDRAHGVFQGQIRVAAHAQKTDAKMSCNTLLLSDDAEFSAKPELEIFADDVACGHGATVTEIDRNHLFYLMARGIDEKIARGLLVKAFVAEIIEELDHVPLVEALEARLDGWFAVHG